jgi:hypothetical protein
MLTIGGESNNPLIDKLETLIIVLYIGNQCR